MPPSRPMSCAPGCAGSSAASTPPSPTTTAPWPSIRSPSPRGERGQVLAEVGRHEAALRDLDAAIDLLPPDDPLVAYARRARAEVFAAMGDIDRALTEANAAVELQPGNPWAYFTRARIRSGSDREGAIADLREALARQEPPLPARVTEQAQALLARLASA